MGGVRVSVPGSLNHRFMLPLTIPSAPLISGLLRVFRYNSAGRAEDFAPRKRGWDAQKRPAEKGAEGVIRESISRDLVGQKPDEGSFRGNRQNVSERGVAHAERVVLVPSPVR